VVFFSASDFGIESRKKNNENFYETKSGDNHPLNCSGAVRIRLQENLN
jgi:hypothetical protein